MLVIPTSALSNEGDLESVTVEILGRAFIPDQVLLHQGKKTVLRFHNQDTELHAVVAKELFPGISLNVGGNGAPEFGPNGLTRVIIPPDGLIEIQFIPPRPGRFSYLCDMPGHKMQAAIVIE